MKKILFALLCVLCAGSSYATRYKISDIYELAKANNTEELAKVSNINGHDMYKDTAICHAIKDGNVEAYKLLLAHGAKADHACTKKIPEQDYNKFMDKVAASSATKTTGFLGLSKWLWGALGLGVVGTGAVIAASGSGGGDSGTADNTNKCDGYIASCDTGYKVVDTCQSGNTTMVKCEFDDEHYVKQNGQVYEKLNCQNGGTQVGNTCQCITGYIGDNCETFDNTNFFLDPTDSQIYPKLNCQNGGTQNANTCNCVTGWEGTLCDTPASCTGYDHTSNATCPEGYTTGSSCLSGTTTKYMCDTLIPLNCSNGHQEGTVCSCDDGWEGTLCDTAHSCFPANEGSSMYAGGCPEGYQLTNVEICQSGNTSYYECALIPLNCSNGHQEGTVCACDTGWEGTLCDTPHDCGADYVSACTGGYEILNTCVSGNNTLVKCHPIQCGANAIWSAAGCICEPGYENWVFGVGCSVPGINDTENPKNKYIYSTTNENVVGIETNDLNTENLYIIKTSDGNVTGLPSGVQNVVRNIYINKTGTGDIYGTTSFDNPGNILIENSGTGYVNGVYGTAVTIYNNAGTDDRDRVINIHNTNNTENVYGMLLDNNGTLYNAFVGDNFNSAGINITNNGANNVYGMAAGNGKVVKIINMEGNGGYGSGGDGGIYISNTGGGNVYGLYSPLSKIENVSNSGYGCVNGLIYIVNNGGSGNFYGIYGNDITNVVSETGMYASGDIIMVTNDYHLGNIYGMYAVGENGIAINAMGGVGTIDITGSNGTIYGMRGNEVHNAVVNNGVHGTGTINIVHDSYSSDIYGMYGKNVYNESYGQTTSEINIQNSSSSGSISGMYSDDGGNVINSGAINITNFGYKYNQYNFSNNEVCGIYLRSDGGSVTNSGTINIANFGYRWRGAVGIFSGTDGSVTNSGTININGSAGSGIFGDFGSIVENFGTINVHHVDVGSSYGAAVATGTLRNYGSINISSAGEVIGIYGGWTLLNANNVVINAIGNYSVRGMEIQYFSDELHSATNSGTISINNVGTGTVYGIRTEDSSFGTGLSIITNTGTINITRNSYTDPQDNTIVYEPTGTSGNVFGIYAQSNSTVNNSGDINIETNGNAYGIYVESGSTVTNTGTISITTSGTAYGIYAEGNSTVTNSGTITLNGVSCNGTTCNGSSSYGNHIVLNGSSLLNKGIMSAPQMNLNSMGGKVIAGLGSQFVVDNELSGDLNIGADIVYNGNQTTYIAENMIDAGDISKLNVRSASAMFDASLADNGKDVVMTMKQFTDLTDNASLAQFLADNYAKGNGNDLFTALKSLENMSAFNGALAGLTGLDTFTQFAHEDLSAMREISFSMNNKLFENSGRDSFDISDSMGYFSFSDSHNGGSGRYGISNDKITDKLKLGYGMAMANINTNDGHGMNRQNKMWLFYMPLTYADEGYELVIAPKAGFANSEYNRRGYNNMNYEGVIEKRIFGLMNDLRYPLTFGNWTFAPDLAFNTIVYEQSGHEEDKEFALVIPDDRTVSVETGLGLYTKYEKTLQDGSRFKLNSGLMVYREFGDTYDIKLGIRGMDGTFSLYNNDYEYRGAASIGFDYTAGRLHVYGNAQYFMDDDNYMNVKGGVSYRF